jgi:hypothetical protein
LLLAACCCLLSRAVSNAVGPRLCIVLSNPLTCSVNMRTYCVFQFVRQPFIEVRIYLLICKNVFVTCIEALFLIFFLKELIKAIEILIRETGLESNTSVLRNVGPKK